jgi:hypothetical protein
MLRTEQFASQLPIRCGGADNRAQSVDQRRLAGRVSGYVSDRRGKVRGPPGIIRNIFRPALTSKQEYGVPWRVFNLLRAQASSYLIPISRGVVAGYK